MGTSITQRSPTPSSPSAGERGNVNIAIAPAIRKVMKHHQLAMSDIDLWELHEAYAVTTLYNQAQLETPWQDTNVNGGAVALGHPIGASGGRIVGTMVHELRRNGGGLGLAAICSGGGQGDALLIEV